MDNELGIDKKMLSAGRLGANSTPLAYPKLTKFTFNYQIRKLDEDHAVLDDTKKYGKTMELYSGKEFQLAFWEMCLETMSVNEVASFSVNVKHLSNFAPVNKKLRDYMLDKHVKGQAKHCCGMMSLQEQGGLGYKDLDQFMEKPEPLEFIFELLKVEQPGDTEKETWIMDNNEKETAIPQLKSEGNQLYQSGDHKAASLKYRKALDILEQLELLEKPGEDSWKLVNSQKIPFLLNLTQCELLLGNNYEAITHASSVLKSDANNVKALYRRGIAHSRVWNLDEAEEDLTHVAELDAEMRASIDRQLANIRKMRMEKRREEKLAFGGKLLAS